MFGSKYKSLHVVGKAMKNATLVSANVNNIIKIVGEHFVTKNNKKKTFFNY